MPKAKLQKVIQLPDNKVFICYRPCILLAEKDKFLLLDAETENILITNATRNFLEEEIKSGRLQIDDLAWPKMESILIC